MRVRDISRDFDLSNWKFVIVFFCYEEDVGDVKVKNVLRKRE